MEEHASTWENAFVLQAMKETNVKLVSSISMCLLSLTSAYSGVSVWMMKRCLPLQGSQRGSHTAGWALGESDVTCLQTSLLLMFDSLLYHLIPYLALFLLVTGLGKNPQALSVQAILWQMHVLLCQACVEQLFSNVTAIRSCVEQIRFDPTPLKGPL